MPVDCGITIGDSVNHLEAVMRVRAEVLGST